MFRNIIILRIIVELNMITINKINNNIYRNVLYLFNHIVII